MSKNIFRCVIAIMLATVAGCAQNQASNGAKSDLRLPRIERELNFYVATHPWNATNHFFVYPTNFRHGQPLRATVYWKEERTLLSYAELEADATHDILAWPGHDLKLDRDTVDTSDEIGGSNYLETHRQWVESMERCVFKGGKFRILATDAQRVFPNQQAEQK